MIYYIFFLVDILCAILGNLLMKKGASHLPNLETSKNWQEVAISLSTNWYLVIGLFSYGISFIMWALVLSKLKLHIAYPIATSLVITGISIGSIILFKETITFLQIVGIVIIMIGIGLLFFTQ